MADWVKVNKGGPGSGFANIAEWTLIAPTTEITTAIAATSGALLIIIVIQDSAHHRAITWSSSFSTATSVEVADQAAGEETTFAFVGRADGKWHQLCLSKLA